jgi:hypothetical protein
MYNTRNSDLFRYPINNYIPKFTNGRCSEISNIANLINCYFKEWDIHIGCEPRMSHCGIISYRNYRLRRVNILINPEKVQEKFKGYAKRRKEAFVTLYHEVLHLDPDFDPRTLPIIASEMKFDCGNERYNKIFKFLIGRFASTWHIEEYLDECAERVYEEHKWLAEEIDKKYNIDKIVNWEKNNSQLVFDFMERNIRQYSSGAY